MQTDQKMIAVDNYGRYFILKSWSALLRLILFRWWLDSSKDFHKKLWRVWNVFQSASLFQIHDFHSASAQTLRDDLCVSFSEGPAAKLLGDNSIPNITPELLLWAAVMIPTEGKRQPSAVRRLHPGKRRFLHFERVSLICPLQLSACGGDLVKWGSSWTVAHKPGKTNRHN